MTEHEAQTKANQWDNLIERVAQILQEYRTGEMGDSKTKDEMYSLVVYSVRLCTKDEIDW